MATGDAAAAKGLPVVPATKDLRLGYDDINAVADAVAAEIDARTSADNGKIATTKIRIQQADPGAVPDGTVWISWS